MTIQNNNIPLKNSQKALSAPIGETPKISSYRSDIISNYIGHSERFQGKKICEVLLNQKSFCQYCYHLHEMKRSMTSTVCDCGKIHEVCLAQYIRRNWKHVEKSQRFAFFYKLKCKKCRKHIYFKDNCKQNTVNIRYFTPLEIKIFSVTLAIIFIFLALICFLIYLAAINDSSALKAVLSISIVFFFGIILFLFRRIIWVITHTKFYQQSVKKKQYKADSAKTNNHTTSKIQIIQNQIESNIIGQQPFKRDFQLSKKPRTSIFHRYNKKKSFSNEKELKEIELQSAEAFQNKKRLRF